jgi:hypothetical protein
MARVLTILAVVVLAVGCGDDERAVTSTVEELAAALVAGDGETACSLLTPTAREELLAAVLASDQSGPHFRTCAAAASTLEGEDPPPAVDDVSIAGTRATATVDGPRGRLDVGLELQAAGEWLVFDARQLLFGPPDL